MKNGIHPKIHTQSIVRCACGHAFAIPSTMPAMEVEICSNCHPFYTGTKKIVDATGQVEKFKARLQKTKEMQTKKQRVQRRAPKA